jgi:hypothetical protein
MPLMNPPLGGPEAGPARPGAPAAGLPDRRPDNMWAGRSAGDPCALCGAQVNLDEMEYELEYGRSEPGSSVVTYHVHISCFTARIWKVRDPEGGSPPVSFRRQG